MRKNRRILLVVPLPPPVHGASLMSQRLVQSRRILEEFRVRVIPLQFVRSLGSLQKFSPGKLARALLISLRILKEMIFFRPALAYSVITPSGYSHYRDLIWSFLQRLFRIPRLYHVRECGFAERNNRFFRWRMRQMFSGAHVIVLSPLMRGEVTSWVPEDRIHVIPNGIPDDFGLNPLKAPARQSKPVVLFLSNIMAQKGVFVMLQAAAILRKRGMEFEVVVAGAYGRDVSPRDFSARIQALGLDSRIRIAGPVTRKEKNELLRRADLMVFPTLREAFGNVLLEAMAAGVPVVASGIGSIPWIVQPGETGLLFSKGDSRDLADKLASLLTDPAERDRMGRKGRERYEAMFTFETFEDRMLETFTEISGKGVKQ